MANSSLLPLFLFERRSESFSDRWQSFCIRKKRSRSGRDCRFFTFVHLFRRFFSTGYWEKSIDFALSCKFQPRFHFNSPLLHGLFFTATIARPVLFLRISSIYRNLDPFKFVWSSREYAYRMKMAQLVEAVNRVNCVVNALQRCS